MDNQVKLINDMLNELTKINSDLLSSKTFQNKTSAVIRFMDEPNLDNIHMKGVIDEFGIKYALRMIEILALDKQLDFVLESSSLTAREKDDQFISIAKRYELLI